MMINHTIELMHSLRLGGMARALEHQLSFAKSDDQSFAERISFLVESERTSRESKKIARLLQAAKLKHNAILEDAIYTSRPGMEKAVIASLAQCDWIKQHHNLTITGPTGCGKTWLACAFAQQACRNLMSAYYVWVPTLLKDLEIGHADGSFRKKLNQLSKVELLVLDDFGIKQLSAAASHDLLEVIDARADTKSTLITSQYPINKWHSLIGDETIADAILDRVVHNAHRITLSGASMRKTKKAI